MSLKSVLILCASALLIQSISGQCIGGPYGAYSAAPYAATPFSASPFAIGPYAGAPCGAGYNAAAVPSSNGGGLAISSASPILPSGVSVLSENAIEGALAVGGQLPFLGTVALEGALPTAGAGNVAYGCGNGNVGIVAEEAGPAGYNALAAGFAPGFGYGPAAYGPGFAAPGYGCGAFV